MGMGKAGRANYESREKREIGNFRRGKLRLARVVDRFWSARSCPRSPKGTAGTAELRTCHAGGRGFTDGTELNRTAISLCPLVPTLQEVGICGPLWFIPAQGSCASVPFASFATLALNLLTHPVNSVNPVKILRVFTIFSPKQPFSTGFTGFFRIFDPTAVCRRDHSAAKPQPNNQNS
jgi:hypothetical protein